MVNHKIRHFTASALIIDNSKVLLLYHKKLDVWLYPGGHIEENENPDKALAREVKEEAGLEIEVLGKKDDSLSDKKNDVSSLHLPYAFLCELVGDHYNLFEPALLIAEKLFQSNPNGPASVSMSSAKSPKPTAAAPGPKAQGRVWAASSSWRCRWRRLFEIYSTQRFAA